MTRFINRSRQPRLAEVAMTLVELMIAVTLMSIIVIGLYTMFDHTQKIMRAGVSQVDVQEGARAATGLIGSDLEQLAVTDIPGVYNFFVSTNPYVAAPIQLNLLNQTNQAQIQGFYFFAHDTQWKMIGYRVDYPGTNVLDQALLTNGVGTLRRYEYPFPPLSLNSNLFQDSVTNFTFYQPNPTGSNDAFNHVLDGVVHFQIRALDPGGIYLTNAEYWYTNAVAPAAVEVEIGVMEPQVVGRARGMLNSAQARAYLATQTGKIHLYRQRVTIHSVVP